MGEPTTEAGKRLLSFLDDPENAQSPLEPQWVAAIEAEAYAMGHNDGKVPWPSRDAARAEARAAVLRELRDEVAGMKSDATMYDWSEPPRPVHEWIDRASVLAAIDRRLGDD